MLSSWIHVAALSVYLGTLISLWAIFLPVISEVKDHEEQIRLLARSLKRYDPVQTAALGLLVLSGAFQLTDLKSAYRELFLQEIGLTLELKLICSFFLIILSTYQTMGIAHRFVRRHQSGEALSFQEFQSVVRRLRVSTLPILLLAAFILWLGVQMRMS